MPFLEGRTQGRGNLVNSRAKWNFASQARVIVETHAARQKATLIYVSEGPPPVAAPNASQLCHGQGGRGRGRGRRRPAIGGRRPRPGGRGPPDAGRRIRLNLTSSKSLIVS